MPKILGVGLSPFVRKTRVFLAEKGVAYDLEPVFPGSPDPEYRKKSPLGKIPCYEEEDGFVVPDSSVICAYLESIHPSPALYPSDPKLRARAQWYEEYADTKLLEGTIVPFVQRVVNAKFLKQEVDEGAIRRMLEEVTPGVFEYLEGEIGDSEYLVGGQFGIADIAVASPFVNMQHGGESIDAGRFPKLAAYVDRLHARPSFKALIEEEKAAIPG
ncbi:MAG: glutathione S-transferase family protein [Myxococcota bacterium]